MQPSGEHSDIIKTCIQFLKTPEFALVACRETTNAGGEKILEVTRAKQLGLLGDNLHPVTVTLTETGLCTVAVLFRPVQRQALQLQRDLQHLRDLLQRVADPVRYVFCPGILPDQAKLCEKDKRLVVHQHPFRRYQAADCPVWHQLSALPGVPSTGPLQMCAACQCLVSAHVQALAAKDAPPAAAAAASRTPVPRAVTTAAPSSTFPVLAGRISSSAGSLPPAASVTAAPCLSQHRLGVGTARPPDAFPPQAARTCAGGVVATAANSLGHVQSWTSVAAGHAVSAAPGRQVALSPAVVISSSGVVPGHRQSLLQGPVVSNGPVLQGLAAGHTPSPVTVATTPAVTLQHASSGFPHGAGAASLCPVPVVLTRNNVVPATILVGPQTALAEMIRSGCPMQVIGSSSSQVPYAGPNVPDHVMKDLRAQNCERVVSSSLASNTNPSVLLSSGSKELTSGPTDGPLDLSQMKLTNTARQAVNSSLQGLPLVLPSGNVVPQDLGRTPGSQPSNLVPPSAAPTASGNLTSSEKSAVPQNVSVTNPPRCFANSSSVFGGPQIVVSAARHSQASLTVSRGPAPVCAQQLVVMPTSTQACPSQRDSSYSVAGPSPVASLTWTRTLTSDTLSSAQVPVQPRAPTATARPQAPGAIGSTEWLANQTSQRVPLSQSGTGQSKQNLKMVTNPNMAVQISALLAQKASNSSGPSGSATAAADSTLTRGRSCNSSTRPAQTWQNGRAPGAAEQGGDSRGLTGSGASGRPSNASSQSAVQNGSTAEATASGNQHPPVSAVPPSATPVQTDASPAQLPAQPLRLPTVTSGYVPPSTQVAPHATSAQGSTGAAVAGVGPAERDRRPGLTLPVKKRHTGRQPLPEASESSAVVSNGPRFSTPNTTIHVRPDFIHMPSSGTGSLRAPMVSTTLYRGSPPLVASQSVEARYQQFQIRRPPSQAQARDVQAPPQGGQGQLSAAPASVVQAPAQPSPQAMLRLVQNHPPPAAATSTAVSSNSVASTGPVLGSSPAGSSAGLPQAVLSTAPPAETTLSTAAPPVTVLSIATPSVTPHSTAPPAVTAFSTSAPSVAVCTGNATAVPTPLYPPGSVVFKIPNPVDSTKPAKKPRSRSSPAKSRSKQAKNSDVIFIPISFQSAVAGTPVSAALAAGSPVVTLLDHDRPVLSKDVPFLRFHTAFATPAVTPNASTVTSAVGQSAVVQSGQVTMQSGSLATPARAPDVAAPAANAGNPLQTPGSVQGPSNTTLTKDPKDVTDSQQEPPSKEGTANKKSVKRAQRAKTSPSKKTSASPSRRKGKTKDQAAVPATGGGQALPSQMHPTENTAENAPRQSRSLRKEGSSPSRSRQRKPKPKSAVVEGEHPPAPRQDAAAPAAIPTAAPAATAATAATPTAAPAASTAPAATPTAAPVATAAPALPTAPPGSAASLADPPANAEAPKEGMPGGAPLRRKAKKKKRFTVRRRPKASRGEPKRRDKVRGQSQKRLDRTALTTLRGMRINGFSPSGLAASGSRPTTEEEQEDTVATRVRSKARTTRNTGPWLGIVPGHGSGQNGDSALWYENAFSEKPDAWVPVTSPEGVTIHLPEVKSAAEQDQPNNSLFNMLIDAANSALVELNSQDPRAPHTNDDSTRNSTGLAIPEAQPRTEKDVYDFQEDSNEAPSRAKENGLTSTVSRESASTALLGGSKRHNKSRVCDVANDSAIMTSATCVSNPERSASVFPAAPETYSRLTAAQSQETGTQRQAPVDGKSDGGPSSGQNVAAAAVSGAEESKENGHRSCEGKDETTTVDRCRPNAAATASENAVTVQSSPPLRKEGETTEFEPAAHPQSGTRPGVDRLLSEEEEPRLTIDEGPSAQMESEEQANPQHPRRTQGATWCCSICKAEYKNQDLLQHHMKIHTAWKPFYCSVCKKNFPSPEVLRTHVESHGDPKLKLCNICYKVLQGRGELCRHQKKHRQPRRVSCPVCSMSFQKTSSLQMHMGCHSKDSSWGKQKEKVDTGGYEPLITQKASSDVDDLAKIFSCPHCKKTFKTHRWCRLHMPTCLAKKQERERKKAVRQERTRLAREAKRQRSAKRKKEARELQALQVNNSDPSSLTPAADQQPPPAEEEEEHTVQDTHEIGGIITPELSSLQEEDVEDDADAEYGSDLENPGTPSTVAYLITPPCSPSEAYHGRWDDVPFEQDPGPVEVKREPADMVEWEEGAMFAIRPEPTPAAPETEGLAFAEPLDLPVLTPPKAHRSLVLQLSRNASSVRPPGPEEGDGSGVVHPLQEASTTDPPAPCDKNDQNGLHIPSRPEENEIQPVIMEVKSVPESEFHRGFYPEETRPLSPAASSSTSFSPCTSSANTSSANTSSANTSSANTSATNTISANTSATSQEDSLCQEQEQMTSTAPGLTVNGAVNYDSSDDCIITSAPSGFTPAPVQAAPAVERTKVPLQTLETARQDILDSSQYPAAAVSQANADVIIISDDVEVCGRASGPDVMSSARTSTTEGRPQQISRVSDSPPPLLRPQDAPFGSDLTHDPLPPVLTRIDESSPPRKSPGEVNDSCRGGSQPQPEGPFRALAVTRQDPASATASGRRPSGALASPSTLLSRRPASGMSLPVVIHRVYDPALEKRSASASSTLTCVRDTVFSKRRESQVEDTQDEATPAEGPKETGSSQKQLNAATPVAASKGTEISQSLSTPAATSEVTKVHQSVTMPAATSKVTKVHQSVTMPVATSKETEICQTAARPATTSKEKEIRQSLSRLAATSKELETRRKFDLLCALARSRKARRGPLRLSNTSEDDGAMDMIEVDVAEDLQDKGTEAVAAAADRLDAGDGTNEAQFSNAPPNAELDKNAKQNGKGERLAQEKKSKNNQKERSRKITKTSTVAGKIRSQKKAKKSRAHPASENGQESETLGFWRDTSPLPLLISPKRYTRKSPVKKLQFSEGASMLPAKVNICERVKQRKRPERNLCEKVIFRQLSAWAVHTSNPRKRLKSPLGSARYRRKRLMDKPVNRKTSLKQWRSRQSSPCKARRLFPKSKAATARRKSTEKEADAAHLTQESEEDKASDREDGLDSAAKTGEETPRLPAKSSCPRVVMKRLTSVEVSCASGRKSKRVKRAASPVSGDIMGSADTDNAETAGPSLASSQVQNAAASDSDEDERSDDRSDDKSEASDAVDVAQHVTAEDSNRTQTLAVETAERTETPSAKTDQQHFFHPNKGGLFAYETLKQQHNLKDLVIRLSRCDPVIIEHLKKIGKNNACHFADVSSADSDGWTAVTQDEDFSDDANDYAFVTPDVCNDEFDPVDDDEADTALADTHQTSERKDDATTGSNAVRMQTPPSPLPSPSPSSPCPSVSPPLPKTLKVTDGMFGNPKGTPAEAADKPETSQETPCGKTAASDAQNVGEFSTQTPSDHPTASVAEEEEDDKEDSEIFPEMFSVDGSGHLPRRHLARRRPYYDSDDAEQEVTWSRAGKERSSAAGVSTDNHPMAPGSEVVRETTYAQRDQEKVEKRSTNVHASGLSSRCTKPMSNFTGVHSSSSMNGIAAGNAHVEEDERTLQSDMGILRESTKENPSDKSTEQTGNKNTLVPTQSVFAETKSPLALKRKQEGTFQAASKRFKRMAVEPSMSSSRNPGQLQMNGVTLSKSCSVVRPPNNLHLPLSDIRVQLTRKDKVPSNLLRISGEGSKEHGRPTPAGTVAKIPEESSKSTSTAAPEKRNPRIVVTLKSKEMNGDAMWGPVTRASSGDRHNDSSSRTPRSSSAETLSRSPFAPARPAGLNGQAAGALGKRKDTSPERSSRSAEKRQRSHVTRSSSRDSDASRSPSTGRKPQAAVTKSWFMRSRSSLSPTRSPDRAQRRAPKSEVDRDSSPSTAAKPRTVTVSTQNDDDSGKYKGRTSAATCGSAENSYPMLKSLGTSDSMAGQTLTSPQIVHVAVTRNDVAKMKSPFIPLVSIDSKPRNGASTRLEDRNIFSMFGDSLQ